MQKTKSGLEWQEFCNDFIYYYKSYCFIYGQKYLYLFSDSKEAHYSITELYSRRDNLLSDAIELLQYVRLGGKKITDIWSDIVIYEEIWERRNDNSNDTKFISKKVYRKETWDDFLNELVNKKKYFSLTYKDSKAELYFHYLNDKCKSGEEIVYTETFKNSKELINNTFINGKQLKELWEDLSNK